MPPETSGKYIDWSKKQFNHKPPVQIHTTNNRIPIKLDDENYIALIDTGSDICTIPDKILLQDDNLRRLPRFKSHSITNIQIKKRM